MDNLGIVSIVNKANGRQFIFKSKFLIKKIENTRNLLNFGCHYNHDLQRDWDEFGPSNFNFNIVASNLNDEVELNSQFLDYLDNVNYVYNFAVNDLIKPLDSDIEILSNKFLDIVGKDFNTNKFNEKLLENNLSVKDGEIFKTKFIDSIKQGLINFYNFDDEYNSFFKKFFDEKLIDSLESTLEMLDFNSKIKEHDLDQESKSRIINDLKNRISEEKVFNLEDISKQLDSLIEVEYSNKLKKDAIYKRLYDLTGKNNLKREFKYYLRSKDLPQEVGYSIRDNLKELIEKGEVTLLNIDDVYTILIEEEFKKSKQKQYNKKQRLINKLEEMDFVYVLNELCLHENVQFKVKSEIISLIDSEKIKSVDDVEFKVYRLIKDMEVIDVKNRLNNLEGSNLDFILKKHNIKQGRFSRKSSKINKIIENVPINIIKENIKFITGDLEPIYFANPNIKFCIECGSENDFDSDFCNQCGNKFV